MNTHWSVSKFGGSSVRDACAIKRCANIIRRDCDQKVIVASATQGTSNQLEELAQIALEKLDRALLAWQDLFDRHLAIAAELGVLAQFKVRAASMDSLAHATLESMHADGEIVGSRMDDLYSLGERMSSLILAIYLDAPWIDARLVLKTNHQHCGAIPLIRETQSASRQVLLPQIRACSQSVVTQGFIGGTLNGKTTTFGREGSDYSAALFAEAIGASKCTIWTDVPGVATGDPRHIPDACYIPALSYHLATRIAEAGANVLFPRTLEPARRADISVFVRSSRDVDAPGTRIQRKVRSEPGPVAVAAKVESVGTVVSVVGQDLLSAPSFVPEQWLQKNGVAAQLHHQDDDRFAFLVEDEQKLPALRSLHDCLMAHRASRILTRKNASHQRRFA